MFEKRKYDIGKWLNIGSALFAFAAAVFWFWSALGELSPIVTYWGQAPQADPFYQALQTSALRNAIAAFFSGLSAVLFTIKVFFYL
jgi:hypothetical protein